MSDEINPRERPFEFPMMPIFGVDLGERLGEFAAGQKQMRGDIRELNARMDKLETKIDVVDARVDKCLAAIIRMDERMNAMDNRLDERTKNLESKFNLSIGLTGAVLAAVLAGIVLQFFFKGPAY